MAKRKAIMVEEGTTNLLPSDKAECEVGPDATPGNVIWSIDTARKRTGNGSLKIQWDGGDPSWAYSVYRINLENDKTYTASVYVYVESSIPVRLQIQETASPWRTFRTTVNIPAHQWTRLVVTFTLPSDWNQPTMFQKWCGDAGNLTTQPLWYDSAQIEEKAFTTSFIDGTRSPETLTIPTAGVLNPQEGTVECWVKAQDIYSRRRDIFTVNTPFSSDDRVILGYNVTGTGLDLYWRPANAPAYAIRATNLGATTDWVYVGFRYKWNGTGYDLALLYNGQVAATGTATNGQMTNFYQALLGCTDQGSGVFANFADMLFDDLRISNRARTDEEIAQAYASGQPHRL